MATIQQIEQNLINYSLEGNVTLFLNTMSSITEEQLPFINTYDPTLANLSILNDPYAANIMTRSLMSKAGAFVDVHHILVSSSVFAQKFNYQALDAVTDYLTDAQKEQISRYHSWEVNRVVDTLARNDTPDSADDTVIANAVRDFMKKLGSSADGFSIVENAVLFAQNQNYKALDALTDYLTAAQKDQISHAPYLANQVINNLTYNDRPWDTTDDTVIANAVRDFMVKLGSSVEGFSIVENAVLFAQNQNYKALDALTDYLTAAQKDQISHAPYLANQVINNLTYNDRPWDTTDDTVIANAVRDFMKKLGSSVEGFSIVENAVLFAQNQNYKALDALTDYLTAAQKDQISHAPYLADQVINNLTYNDRPWDTTDDAVIANAVRDFMVKLGSSVEGFSIVENAILFAQNQNYKALDALTDYLTAAQKDQISHAPYLANQVINNLTYNDRPWDSADDAVIANAVRDFMKKLGSIVEGYAIIDAAQHFAINHNYAALDAVTDYLTTAQKTDITYHHGANSVLTTLVGNDTPWNDADDNYTAAAVRDFTSKLGSAIDSDTLSMSAEQFLYHNNYNGFDAVIGNADLTKFSDSALEILDQALNTHNISLGTNNADYLFGTNGNDTYLGLKGNDYIFGSNGDDNLFGDAGNDYLNGGYGNDFMHGGDGNDSLYDYSGTNVLFGGKGSDQLYGGADADTFGFEKADIGTGVDTIVGFSVGQGDRIDISAVLTQYDPVTDAISNFVKLTTSGANTILQIDVDGTGTASGFQNVAVINSVTGLDLQTLVDNHTIIVNH